MFKYIHVALLIVWACIVKLVACAVPRSSRKIVIGGWGGGLYCDNTKYLAEWIIANTNLMVVWIGHDAIKADVPLSSRFKFSRKNSMLATWHLLTSKTWVCTHNIPTDFTSLPLLGRGRCINTWHGIPVKRIDKANGKDVQVKTTRKVVQRLLGETGAQWLCVSSEKMIGIMLAGLTSVRRDRILRVGTPRNDFLIANQDNDTLKRLIREKYAEMFHFEVDKKIVLYLPTWRINNTKPFTFYSLARDALLKFEDVLHEGNAIVIEKYHHATFLRQPPPIKANSCAFRVVLREQERCVNVQELLLVADLLITDYSGAYIDFALQNKPCIHFNYDFDEYRNNDAGLAYEFEDVRAGRIVKNVGDLIAELDCQLKTPFVERGQKYKALVEFEKGMSCEQLAKFIEG